MKRLLFLSKKRISYVGTRYTYLIFKKLYIKTIYLLLVSYNIRPINHHYFIFTFTGLDCS